MTTTNNTTWNHANITIGNQLRRVVVATAGPDTGLAASFATTPNGEVDALKKIHFFTATTWEQAVTLAETYA